MNWASRGNKEPDKNKQLHVMSVKEYEELEEELAKYKRAFEILNKGKLLGNNLFCLRKKEPEFYYLNTYDNGLILTKEEYELLEELMKGEK